jgi:DNA-binding transcriptional LysR family regulator
MDRLGNIEAFVEAAELGSFTLAARRLRLSPSAFSRRVAQLEDEIGVRLFHRTTRAVRLSEDGRAFFERARGALRELAEAQAAMVGLRDRPAGLLRVEAPTILGRHVVVPAMSRLVARHPDVQVELTTRDVASDIAANGIDVAVRLGALADSALIARRLGHTRMRVCGAPSYFRRKGKPRTVGDLADHELLGYAAHGRVLRWRLRDGGTIREIAPSRRVVVDSADALIDLAAGGAGLAWLCDFMIARPRREGQLVEILADTACEESPIHVVSLPTRQVLPKVRAFVDLVAAELDVSPARRRSKDR